jgi:PPOX class probable F420-dependent enzyme
MKLIPVEFEDLLMEGTKAFAILGTIMPDGSPQVTPIWFNTEAEHILINTAKGRQKDRNMRARPQIAMTILDPRKPYRYIQIRGVIDEITEKGAAEHISVLSQKYRGHDFNIPKGQIRVTYKILPQHVSTED